MSGVCPGCPRIAVEQAITAADPEKVKTYTAFLETLPGPDVKPEPTEEMALAIDMHKEIAERVSCPGATLLVGHETGTCSLVCPIEKLAFSAAAHAVARNLAQPKVNGQIPTVPKSGQYL